MAIKDLRVGVRLWNNQLRERRESAGLTLRELGVKAGVSYQECSGFETMRLSPVTAPVGKFGKPAPVEWRKPALRIAEALGVAPAVLWPDAILAVEKTTAEVRINAEEIATLLTACSSDTPLDLLAAAEVDAAIAESLEVLSPRERRIIEMRFGIDGTGDGAGATHRMVAEVEGVSRGRIHQLESKALRKLRGAPAVQIAKAKGWR